MTQSNFENVKRKLHELDLKVATTSHIMLSYLQAILAVLDEKGITNREEFQQHLEKSKQELLKMSEYAQFVQTMKDVLPEKGKGADDSAAPPSAGSK